MGWGKSDEQLQCEMSRLRQILPSQKLSAGKPFPSRNTVGFGGDTTPQKHAESGLKYIK